MSSQSPRPRRKLLAYLARVGAGSLALSIAIHVGFVAIATFYVVSVVSEQRKVAFTGGGSGDGTGGPAAESRHQVSVARQNATPVPSALSQKLVVEGASSVALPELPALGMPASAVSASSGGPSGSLGGGLGSGAGTGTGAGPGTGALRMMPFGLLQAPKAGALTGYLYDLKQSRARKPNPDLAKLGPKALAIKEVTAFIKSGWRGESLAEFFRSPSPLFATQIFVPVMAADEAPKAYGVESVVQPRAWVAHYKGRVSPPLTGVYRFVGAGDDHMAVRLDGRLVIDAGGAIVSGFETDRPAAPSYPYAYGGNDWILRQRRGFTVGKRMELRAGQFYDIDIVLSEGPGGLFCAMLLVEQEGVTYQKVAKGNPILPLFRLADAETATSPNAPAFMPGGPVWRAVPSPGK